MTDSKTEKGDQQSSKDKNSCRDPTYSGSPIGNEPVTVGTALWKGLINASTGRRVQILFGDFDIDLGRFAATGGEHLHLTGHIPFKGTVMNRKRKTV